MEPQRSFRNFLVREEAEAMAEALRGSELNAVVQDNSSFQDPLFSGASLPSFHVLLLAHEFERAEDILRSQMGKAADEMPDDHYLHEFSDQELMDVLMSPSEWNELDMAYARRLLQQRGQEIPDELLAAARKARLRDLRAPAPSQTAFIVLGYVSAFLGGLLGIAIGWYINTAKKTLPNGERVAVYSASDRRHGARLFIIGIVVTLGLLVYRVVVILGR